MWTQSAAHGLTEVVAALNRILGRMKRRHIRRWRLRRTRKPLCSNSISSTTRSTRHPCYTFAQLPSMEGRYQAVRSRVTFSSLGQLVDRRSSQWRSTPCWARPSRSCILARLLRPCSCSKLNFDRPPLQKRKCLGISRAGSVWCSR
jgi:hypothetical protein